MNKFCVYIPNFNGAEFLKTIKIPQGFDCVVMDNCSKDSSEKICAKREFKFVKNKNHVSRVDNWLRCIDHFRNSEYEWLKWLFVGDELNNNAYAIISDSVSNFPEAAILIFDYDIINNSNVERWRATNKDFEIKSFKDVSQDIISRGNIFGALLSTCISKRAVEFKIEAPDLDWVADLQILYQMAKRGDTVFLPRKIGSFNSDNRKFFNKKANHPHSYIEILEVIKNIIRNTDDLDDKAANDFILRSMSGCLRYNYANLKGVAKLQILVFKTIFTTFRQIFKN